MSRSSLRSLSRYRLRTLVLVVTIVPLLLAWIARERQQSLLEERLAGSVARNYMLKPWHAAHDLPDGWWNAPLDFACGPRMTATEVPRTSKSEDWPLASLTMLRQLDLDGDVVGLSSVTGLRRLETLEICNSRRTDWAALGDLQQLRYVLILASSINDLSPFSRLSKLKRLEIVATHVKDLGPLAGLMELESVQVPYSDVADLRPIADLTGLNNLNISYCKVADLSPLVKLRKLNTLYCDGVPVRDVSPLGMLSELKTLTLAGTEVRDLTPLQGLRKLTTLKIDISKIAPLELEEFKRAMPQCQVHEETMRGVVKQNPLN